MVKTKEAAYFAQLLIEALKDNEIWMNIRGNSMAPLLKNGTLALIKKSNRLLCADILVYKDKNKIIAHRLIRKLRNIDGNVLYQTKADNGYVLDELVRLQDIVGKIIAIKKEDRTIRLDTFSERIKARSLWFVSVIRTVVHKYVKIRSQISHCRS